MKTKKQLNFSDFIDDFNKTVYSQKSTLIELFDEFIDLKAFIPASFYEAYYSSAGRKRAYPLTSMISALLLQKFLSLPYITTVLSILALSSELRDFCGFGHQLPDPAQFTRFKSDFESHINEMFHVLVDETEPLCQAINSELANILISDTTGFEAFVKENNPKFFEGLIRQGKNRAKYDKYCNPHLFAASKMPKSAEANPEIKLAHLNGHFGYYQKANIVTNGLGIVRHIDFYDNDLEAISPELKDQYDSRTLIPVLESFFKAHPDFKYKYFLGDAGFDAHDNYRYLYEDKKMIPIIPLRAKPELPTAGFNKDGIPTCPYDDSLEMIYDGVTRQKGRSDRIKFKCPKCKKRKVDDKKVYVLECVNPCTPSSYGRVVYIPINKDYRLHCAIPRNSIKWNKLYKIRTICERAIAQLKHTMCLRASKVRKTNTIKVDVLLAGIAQLISLIILFQAKMTDHPMSIKSLVA